MPLDADGYPSDEDLKRIAQWAGDWHALMACCRECWNYADIGFWVEDDTTDDMRGVRAVRYRLATGGWSGNESVIAALRDNYIFTLMHWWGSLRGGLHIYVIPKEEAPDAE